MQRLSSLLLLLAALGKKLQGLPACLLSTKSDFLYIKHVDSTVYTCVLADIRSSNLEHLRCFHKFDELTKTLILGVTLARVISWGKHNFGSSCSSVMP